MTETEQRFKKTNIGSFPADWKIIKIGNYSTIDEKSLKSNTDDNFTFKYISLSDIVKGKINIPNKNISFKQAPSRARRIVSNGDILLSTVRPNLKAFGMLENSSEPTIASTGFAIISCKQGLHAKFLLHNLFSNSINRQFYMLVVGSNYPAINSSDVKNLKIPLPSLAEQQKIAEILSTWDEAIDKTQQLIKHLDLRKRGLMQQLLLGKIRLPGFSGEWKEEKLGNYFKERKETGYYDLPLLSVGKNGIYPQDVEKKDTSNSDKSKYKRIRNGDIGYNTMRMWQGRSAISNMEGIVSPAYTILQPRENCDTLFFSYLFKLELMVNKFYRNSQGMVSDTWMCKFKDLALVKFDAPSGIEEQKAIAAVLITADKEIEKIKEQMKILRTQKKGLMQQLLTGKKRVRI